MSWHLARSLETFRTQVNEKWPNRSKASDGTIGDEAHQSSKSDHNPDADGAVKAIDITHDPSGGPDCTMLAEMLWAGKDYRVGYIIWNKQISNPDIENGAWRPYTGSNPHTMHLHLSVKKEGCEDPQEWKAVPVSPIFAAAGPMPKIKRGQQGVAVEVLQNLLGLSVDGYFGAETEAAVEKAQKELGLVVDGIVGPYTWEGLANA
jgi:hypothetical protein